MLIWVVLKYTIHSSDYWNRKLSKDIQNTSFCSQMDVLAMSLKLLKLLNKTQNILDFIQLESEMEYLSNSFNNVQKLEKGNQLSLLTMRTLHRGSSNCWKPLCHLSSARLIWHTKRTIQSKAFFQTQRKSLTFWKTMWSTSMLLSRALWLRRRSSLLNMMTRSTNCLSSRRWSWIQVFWWTNPSSTGWRTSKCSDRWRNAQTTELKSKMKFITSKWKTSKRRPSITRWSTRSSQSSHLSFVLGKNLLMGNTNNSMTKVFLKFKLSNHKWKMFTYQWQDHIDLQSG